VPLLVQVRPPAPIRRYPRPRLRITNRIPRAATVTVTDLIQISISMEVTAKATHHFTHRRILPHALHILIPIPIHIHIHIHILRTVSTTITIHTSKMCHPCRRTLPTTILHLRTLRIFTDMLTVAVVPILPSRTIPTILPCLATRTST
jgi:hypothetical protein